MSVTWCTEGDRFGEFPVRQTRHLVEANRLVAFLAVDFDGRVHRELLLSDRNGIGRQRRRRARDRRLWRGEHGQEVSERGQGDGRHREGKGEG